MRITRELAQAVVDTTMRDLDYPLNIMDETGVIVGSADPGRIGQEHAGAITALRSGRVVEIEVDGATERQGVNLPIEIDGVLIGVVGVTGPLHEVRPLARLVRSSVSLMLLQRQQLSFAAERKARRDLLCERLIGFSGEYPPLLVHDAAEFGVDLTRPHRVVLVEDAEEVDWGLTPLGSEAFSLAPARQAFLGGTIRSSRPSLRLCDGVSPQRSSWLVRRR